MKEMIYTGNVFTLEYYAAITCLPNDHFNIVIIDKPENGNIVLRMHNVNRKTVIKLLHKYKVKPYNKCVWY